MKKSIVLWLIMSSIAKLSLSQVNDYFQHNPVWLVESARLLPGNYCVDNQSANYYVGGDTTLSAILYKKIYKKAVGNIHPTAPGPICSGLYSFTDSLSFFLRSAGKKMFIRETLGGSEYLLYDFNLSVGDTLPVSYNNTDTITVTAIDSIYTPYGYRKRFALAGAITAPNYLVEGIGNSRGLIEPFKNAPATLFVLTCYSINDTSYYPGTGQSCEFFVGIEPAEKQTAFLIYPNPFSESTTIRLHSYSSNFQISIYNIFGQVVKKTEKISGDNILINREDLKAGLYFLELKQNDETLLGTGKFLIID